MRRRNSSAGGGFGWNVGYCVLVVLGAAFLVWFTIYLVRDAGNKMIDQALKPKPTMPAE